MGNEVVKKESSAANVAPIKKEKTIANMLASPDTAWGKELAKMMPNAHDVARFMSCALAQLADPKVGAKLARCTLPSFYNAILKAGRARIMPDGVNAHLIPYGTECTLQFSYRGLCDMAIREKIAVKFSADIVRKNDIFKWSNGEVKEHTIVAWDENERGDIVGVWVRAYLPDADGRYNPELHVDCRMSLADVEKVRAKSQNKNGVWVEWYEEMMKKSCLKRLFKTMQNTPAMQEVIAEDNKEFQMDAPKPETKRITADDLLSGGNGGSKEPEPAPAEDAVDVESKEV